MHNQVMEHWLLAARGPDCVMAPPGLLVLLVSQYIITVTFSGT